MKFIETDFSERVKYIREARQTIEEKSRLYEEIFMNLFEDHLKLVFFDSNIKVTKADGSLKLVNIKIDRPFEMVPEEQIINAIEFLKGSLYSKTKRKNGFTLLFKDCDIFDDVVQVSYFKIKGE